MDLQKLILKLENHRLCSKLDRAQSTIHCCQRVIRHYNESKDKLEDKEAIEAINLCELVNKLIHIRKEYTETMDLVVDKFEPGNLTVIAAQVAREIEKLYDEIQPLVLDSLSELAT